MADKNPIASKLVGGLLIFVVVVVVLVTKEETVDVNTQIDAESEKSTNVLPKNENNDVVFELGADGDTNNDTLRTLTAEMNSIQQQISDKEKYEEKIKNENISFKKELELATENNSEMVSQFDSLLSKISNLEQNLASLNHNKKVNNVSSNPSFSANDEYPISLRKENVNDGIPQLKTPDFVNKGTSIKHNIQATGDIVWVQPLDIEETVNEDGNFSFEFPDIENIKSTELYQSVSNTDFGESTGLDKKENGTPYITINRGATSINAIALTALIGRIPTAGQIVDPFRFKALININTLASNGIVIDGLSGAVVGGSVSGDYTLKCVKANIDYITFTFQDGTISTFPENGTANGNESLGYISDNAGIPCVTGQYLSNGGSYISQQLALSTLAAGGSAFASAQKTTQVSGETSNASVTGDATKFALGEMTNAGITTVSDWFTDRQQGAFDAIYAPPATEITLHFEKQITINYNENGRKTNHAQISQANHSSFDFNDLN
jgi:integrating conjugative element protein (TIGR03752 family)